MVAVTSLWPQWSEAVVGLAPDTDGGKTEWDLTASLRILAIVMFFAAPLQWHRNTGAERAAT